MPFQITTNFLQLLKLQSGKLAGSLYHKSVGV